MTMPAEVELKLGIAPDDIPRLLRHRLVVSQGQGRPRTVSLHNIYYDTPDLALHRHRIALRLRRPGNGTRWIQTLKAEGRAVGGLHERPEWETDTTEGVLCLDELPDAGLQRFFSDPSLRASLQPVFTMEFKRTIVQLAWANGDAVELAVDRGHISADGRAQMLCELELELKSGPPSRLFSVARMLHRSVPLRLSNVSKAQRAYRMISGATLEPQKAMPAPSAGDRKHLKTANATTGELCAAVLAGGLAHLQANEEGARLSEDPSFVHQMRVATRRMRSALKAFVPLLPPDQLEHFQEELRWLGDALSGTRNWDVFVSRSLPDICAALPDEAGLNWLATRAVEERGIQREHARSAIESPRYQGLLLELGAWLATPRWQDAAAAQTPALRFGAEMLAKRHRKLKKYAGNLAGLDVHERHRLRIAGKKLRYAAEFFAPLCPGRRTTRYLDALEGLQNVLGDLNDEATTALLMQQVSAGTGAPEHQRACGLVLGWASGLAREQLPAANKAWRIFTARKTFWPRYKNDGRKDGTDGKEAKGED